MLTGGACAATIRVLSSADLKPLLTFAQIIDQAERAYVWKSEGLTSTFPLVFHEFAPGTADMDIKSGHLKPAGIFGMKLVSFFEPNMQKGIAPLNASIMLYDDTNGLLRAVIEGAHLGGLRTGAAAALGAKHLARRSSEEFLVIGCGHQCTYQVAAMLTALPGIRRVSVCDPRTPSQAVKMAVDLPERLEADFGIDAQGVGFEAIDDLEAAVRRSDVITTITPAREPIVKDSWVSPGTHINCVGADMKGKQEVESALVARARVFTDDTTQCVDVGEIEVPLSEKAISIERIAGEIGDVIVGAVQGRRSENDITLFDTTGLAIQDLAAAKAALDAAEANDAGASIDFA